MHEYLKKRKKKIWNKSLLNHHQCLGIRLERDGRSVEGHRLSNETRFDRYVQGWAQGRHGPCHDSRRFFGTTWASKRICRCVANCVAHASQSRKHVQTQRNNEGADILITLARGWLVGGHRRVAPALQFYRGLYSLMSEAVLLCLYSLPHFYAPCSVTRQPLQTNPGRLFRNLGSLFSCGNLTTVEDFTVYIPEVFVHVLVIASDPRMIYRVINFFLFFPRHARRQVSFSSQNCNIFSVSSAFKCKGKRMISLLFL